jgi:hypothetical protein
MSLADTIYQKSLSLPPEKAREVIDFIDFIKARRPATGADDVSESPSLLAAFEEAGLVGCLDTDEQLATTYKEQLDFSQKHGDQS